jgi:hypothetical protein
MKIECRFIFGYPSSKSAIIIHKSLQMNNKDFLTSQISGKKMEVTITGLSIPSTLHTLNDFLACLTIAEKVAISP